MIDSAAFIQRLNRTKMLPLKISQALMDGLRVNQFDPLEIFLSPGNYATAIYFIQTGYVRGAIDGHVEKMTTWFKQEGDIIIPQGIFNQRTSEEYISAVTKTTVLAIPINNIQRVLKLYPELMELFFLLFAESINDGQYREKLLRFPKAKERYDFMSEQEDFVLKRIPQSLIASYLNVTRETFSRLYKGLPY
jgi:CRP-like cAMP-binding protein